MPLISRGAAVLWHCTRTARRTARLHCIWCLQAAVRVGLQSATAPSISITSMNISQCGLPRERDARWRQQLEDVQATAAGQEAAIHQELSEARAQQDALQQGLAAAREAASQAASSAAAERDCFWQQVLALWSGLVGLRLGSAGLRGWRPGSGGSQWGCVHWWQPCHVCGSLPWS